jgi:hypothetical protein
MHALFATAALYACCQPLRAADPPFPPMATCQFGKCVMTEADFNKYRAYVIEIIRTAEAIQDQAVSIEAENDALRGKLAREAHCEIHRD